MVMKTVINIKADRDVKIQAFATAKDIGVPLSTIINAFLKRFISDRSVTFDAPLRPSKSLEKLLKQAEKDIKAGKNLSPLFFDTKKEDAYLARL
jgi:addiction module RelB/DinJ family antitoxin